MPADLLTAQQAADLLGVSKRTIHRWANCAMLPVAYTLPGSGAMLFRYEDVIARKTDAA